MPFALAVDWFLTRTRSPAITETPSTVCAPERVMFAVVAARTDAFTVRPCAMASTYAFVAASCAEVGSARPVILLPPRTRLPETVVVAAFKLPETVTFPVKEPVPEMVISPEPVMAEPVMEENVAAPPVIADEPMLISPKPLPSEPEVKVPTVVMEDCPT